jgi:hypothetical protein
MASTRTANVQIEGMPRQRYAHGAFSAHALFGVGFVPEPMALQIGRNQVTLSAISHYRGGAIDEVAPLAQTLKAIYLKHGVGYRLSRFQTGPNEGDWLVVVTYADAAAYEKAQALFAQDPQLQQVFIKPCRNRVSEDAASKRMNRNRRQQSLFFPEVSMAQAAPFPPLARAPCTIKRSVGLLR